MEATNFEKHSVYVKRSRHIPDHVQGMTSTTLIDCGVTENFINLAFMRTRRLQPTPFAQSRTCKLGEKTTEVTHGLNSTFEVGYWILPVEFYVMNGKSNQGLVLGYTFLYENDATIRFKSREWRLGGMNIHCLSNQLEGIEGSKKMKHEATNVMDLEHKWGLLCVEARRL